MTVFLIGLMSAVLSGAASFLYFCWFRHIRDFVDGKSRRILYYCLVALSFYALARVTGMISIGLGLLPMLVITSFLPKKGLRVIICWSSALAVVAFAIGAASAYRHMQDAAAIAVKAEDNKSFSSLPAKGWNLNLVYAPKDITPELEFQIIDNFQLGELTCNLPIFMNLGYQTEILKDDNDQCVYRVHVGNYDSYGIVCLFRDIVFGNDGEPAEVIMEEISQQLLSEFLKPGEYLSYIEKLYRPVFPHCIINEPSIIQNTKESFVIFTKIDDITQLDLENRTRIITRGLAHGRVLINNAIVSFVCVVGDPLLRDIESLFMIWFNKFLEINALAARDVIPY